MRRLFLVSFSILIANITVYSQSFNDYLNSAKKGDPKAQYAVGVCYHKGEDVNKDLQKAAEWWLKSAQQGYVYAQYWIARSYHYGEGVSEDLTKAFEWYLKAAEQEHVGAQFLIGDFYFRGLGVDKNLSKAFGWYLKAAEHGQLWAQYMVGVFYYEGNGVSKDLAKSFEWWLKSAEQGYVYAQYCVGECYHYGEGVPMDLTKAFNWYLKAAEQGDVASQIAVAGCYNEGLGVNLNIIKSFEWAKKAAEQGDSYGQYLIGYYYAQGKGVQQDYQKAVEWYEKSASQGYAWAYNNLAYLYINGNGVDRNANKAFDLIDKAINLDPENISFYDSKGEFYSILGDKVKALDMWNKMLSIDAKSIDEGTNFAQYIQTLNINLEKEIESNKWKIEPQFDYAGHFVNNLAIVNVNGKYGFINRQGTFIVKPQYASVRDFKNGFALIGNVHKDKTIWGFVDNFGKVILQPLYIDMKDFSEGLFAYKSSLSGRWGFMDSKGKFVIKDSYIEVTSFKDGFALVDDGSNKGLINKQGKFIEKYSRSEYNKLKSKYIEESASNNIDIDYYPIYAGAKWGYKRISLVGYINSNVENWDNFLSSQLKNIGSYEEYLKMHIETDINEWQRKGEFEPTSKWKERVNEETRRKRIENLTIKYRNEYEEKLVVYKKRYAELAKEYEREYNKYRDEYYTLISQSEEKEFEQAYFELMTYDADNQSFLIKSDKQGDILISVPLEEAPSFKQNWNTIKNTITPSFVPSGDDVVLTSVTVTNGNKKYVYDINTQAKYAVTDINYNFDPVEISIPDVADVNYIFDPVEVIQSTVVQTSPTVKGLEANNATIERKKIDATKQSDVDVNIPQSTKLKSSNTFVVIIANEDYQRVSDVTFAANDGKLFAEYCTKALGLPQNHVMLYTDATLGNMLGAVNRMKEIGEAYSGKANIIFYYAGHGIPDETSKDAYLLPVDGDGSSVRTCYKQSELFAELASIKANSVVVLMDACFSGAQRGDGMLMAARGVAIKAKKSNPLGNMVVFSAAQGDETAYPYKEQRHGMFTYYLLKKLQETKGEATLGEISDYVTSEVRKQSIVINGKMQTPTLTSSSAIGDTWRNWKLK